MSTMTHRERAIDQITKMKENTLGRTEEELDSILQITQKLIAKYNIEEHELNTSKRAKSVFRVIDDPKNFTSVRTVNHRVARAIADLTSTICFSTRSYEYKDHRKNPKVYYKYTFFGMPKDVELAEYIFYTIHNSVKFMAKKYMKSRSESEKMLISRATALWSFHHGMAVSLNRTLVEMIKKTKEETTIEETSTSLVVQKKEEVEKDFAEEGINLSKARKRQRTQMDATSYGKGVEAGKEVTITTGIA